MRMASSNANYQRDMKYILLITRNLLSMLGVWPSTTKEKSMCERIYKYVLITIYYILIFCTLLPASFYWLAEKSTRVRISTVTMLLYGFMIVSQYYNLIVRQDQIRRCLKHIEEDWKSIVDVECRKLMLVSAKKGRKLVAICAALVYSSGISFRLVLPLSRGKIVTAQNITIRPLPYPSYLFSVDIQATPTYELMYTLHCCAGLVILSIGTGVYGLVIVFAMHICGQLRILLGLINNLGKKQIRERSNVDKQLSAIVKCQIRIHCFLRSMEDALHHICFIQITGFTVIICIVGYCIIMEWKNSNSIAMSSYFLSIVTVVSTIFIFSYTGEQVISQAEKVAVASCEHAWYRLPDKQARSMVLVMIMSNKPTKLTAGKLIDLSIKSFGNIIKTAGAYLNVLRNITE